MAQQAALQAAASTPHGGHGPETHEIYLGAVLVDQAELRSNGRGNGTYAFESLAYYGTDYNKLQLNLRAESTQAARELEQAELQVLYSRLVGYYWDMQFGVRHDFRFDREEGTPGRTYGVVGLQGLAPGFFEVNFQAFLGERGVPLLRAEFGTDLLITNRLVLQPEVELEFAGGRDTEALISPGLYRVEAGLRLRYEVTREIAPYIGISYERAVGGAAGLSRRVGENPEVVTALIGVRLFF
jgi:copper resistance protein B